MDAETKEALDALLGERKPKKPTSSFRATIEREIERERERRVRMKEPYEKSFKPKPAPDVRVSWDFGESKIRYVAVDAETDRFDCVASTKDLTAILSIHPAKACVVLRARLTKEFVKELQKLGDVTQVEWKADDKIFYINPTLLPALKLLLKHHYADVQVFGVQKQVKATKFDALMERLTKEDKSKVYRLLAGTYHPDKGGDKDTMALINLVFKGD